MKFYFLITAALVSLLSLNSCKKELPSYCEKDMYGEILLTDALGDATTTFGQGATMNMNLLFINTSSDTVKLTYSEPWITYEVYSGGQLFASSAIGMTTNTGVSGLAVAPSDTVEAYYPWSAMQPNLPVGSYTLKAVGTYQYSKCGSGVAAVEKTTSFTVQ